MQRRTNHCIARDSSRPSIVAVLALAGLVMALPVVSGADAMAQVQPATTPAKPRPLRPGETKPVAPTVIPDAVPVADPIDPTGPARPGKAPAVPGKQEQLAPNGVRDVPEAGPFLSREAAKSWNLKVFIRLNSDRPDQTEPAKGTSPTGRAVNVPKITPFHATKIAVVFPAVESTGSSVSPIKKITGRLLIDDAPADTDVKLMDSALYHSGVKLVRLETDDGKEPQERTAREVKIEYVIPVTCYETKYDEAGADKVPWPTGPWPVEAASTLTPQLFVDMGIAEHGHAQPFSEESVQLVQDMMDRALKFAKVSDSKAVPPARLAKILTRQIWQDIQISGTGKVSRARTGEFVGLDMQAPSETIQQKRGDEHDVTVLAASLFRRAGLPTRTVIGYDMFSKEGAAFLKDESSPRVLRSWVEFCVYDEAKNTINWIPVDIARLRKSSSRPADLAKPWKYFGTNEELSGVIPFALHFHPPTDVVGYRAAGFWGWYVEPQAPAHALQAIRFDASQVSNRGTVDDTKGKDDKDDKVPPRAYR